MKVKSTLVIACLALAFLMTVGTTSAQAQCCCIADWIIQSPFYVTAAALMLTAAVVTAPVVLLGCTNGPLPCNPCCLLPKCSFCR